MRPRSLSEFTGQEHLTGPDGVLTNVLKGNYLPSMIFWGPPGVGKTTLASIIAKNSNRNFYVLSAINSGVKDVREVIEKAAKEEYTPVLFIDEIHRFSKSQQDSLLGAVEKGIITLIGATTENPSFEVISPLLSRCRVYVLKELGKEELLKIALRAIKEDQILSSKQFTIEQDEALLLLSSGDARKLLNILELMTESSNSNKVIINNKAVTDAVQQNTARYDKAGEMHYDIISAFIKSIRGSDPNAAVYWLARMIKGGEDPKFIARRLLILASEDIGNANPTALVLANSCFQAVNVIGYPECSLILSQTAIYLATSEKSNASYEAIGMAMDAASNTSDLPVPLHIRNAPTRLMKVLGYGKNYKYAHSYEGNFAEQEFLPEELKGKKFYEPGKNPREEELRRFLKRNWKDKYGY